jgi:hypothetical protein
MSLVKNFIANTSLSNQIDLNWSQPLGFNEGNSEIIVTRTITHYPMELFNSNFPTKATDSRPVEIFRGTTITGLNTGTISVSANTLTDSAASFPTSPSLKGRLLRDAYGNVFKILSNTSTTVTLDDAPNNGKYIILADFSATSRAQQNFENSINTTAAAGSITNLVELVNGSLLTANFNEDELVNLFFRDANNAVFIIKSNTANTLYFFETALTPIVGNGMLIFASHANIDPVPYVDTFKSDTEAATRTGTGLLNNQFYYYTAFSKPTATNVAQAEYSNIDSGTSTQSAAISTQNRNWGNKLYNLWPSIYRELDSTGDLEDLMQVFGHQFEELHALVDTYRLQDTHTLFATAMLPLSEQLGLPSIGYSIGVDTLRRIGAELISAWRLKGSKEGIALFIRIITTWDITGGTGDFGGSIIDLLPNVEAFRFFDLNLGSTNTRFTQSDPFVGGGRFARSLPGIVIPGFFTFREFVILVPNVALFIGASTSFSVTNGYTTLTDISANFGANDTLIGNYLLPNQEEVNDIFLITGNTNTTITVLGAINNKVIGGNYAVLSPLNTNRFLVLNKVLPYYIPFKTIAGFQFT